MGEMLGHILDSRNVREMLDLILDSTNTGEMLDRTVFWILLIFEGNAGSYSGLYKCEMNARSYSGLYKFERNARSYVFWTNL